MDLNYSWSQPEHIGPAQAIWSKILNDIMINKINNQSSTSLHNYPYYQTEIPIYATITGQARDAMHSVPVNINELIEDSSRNNIKKELSYQVLEFIKRKREYNKASTFGYEIQLQSGKISTIPTDIYPWIIEGKEYEKNIMGLHEEIMDFYHYIMPTKEEQIMRTEVVERLKTVVLKEWPEAVVDVFGSFKTDLHLPTSDIDVVIFGTYENPLWKLSEIIHHSGISSDCKVLDKATVPIVKMTDRNTEVRIDISFNMENGIKSADLIKSYIHTYPRLPHLVLLLKQYLLQRDLNEVWTGGISSYSLILMCVSFMKNYSKRKPNMQNNLGVLFISFLEMYGRNYDYVNTGIRTEGDICYVPKEDILKNMDGSHWSSILCIEDPLNPGNDIGRSSYGALHVKLAFEYAYSTIVRSVLSQSSHLYANQVSILGRIIRITPEVIRYRNTIKRKYCVSDGSRNDDRGGINPSSGLESLLLINNSGSSCSGNSSHHMMEGMKREANNNNSNNNSNRPKCIISERGDMPSNLKKCKIGNSARKSDTTENRPNQRIAENANNHFSNKKYKNSH